MRFQEPIFENSPDRNTDLYNVNMSSDLCIYEEPRYTVSGGCKIVTGITTADTCVHIVNNFYSQIDLEFLLSGGTTATTFSINIYKYNNSLSGFADTIIYSEVDMPYSGSHTTNLVAGSLVLDGEYLIKLFYIDPVCTDILGRLGETIDTSDYPNGSLYNLYSPGTDYYFIVFLEATVPNVINQDNPSTSNRLATQTIFPSFDGQFDLFYNDIYIGEKIVTLNGLTLALNYDYSITNDIITFIDDLKMSDVVTVAGVTDGNGYDLLGSYEFEITGITSGATGGQGSSNAYFNEDTDLYELFTPTEILGVSLVSINGVTIAPTIDYSASSVSNNGIVLNGIIDIDDVITIVYQSPETSSNITTTPNPLIEWLLVFPPTNTLGWFKFEVSDVADFSNIIYTAQQNYVVGQLQYAEVLPTTGYSIGDTLYYRITNNKVYQTIMGDELVSTNITDIIPMIIMY